MIDGPTEVCDARYKVQVPLPRDMGLWSTRGVFYGPDVIAGTREQVEHLRAACDRALKETEPVLVELTREEAMEIDALCSTPLRSSTQAKIRKALAGNGQGKTLEVCDAKT